MGCIPDQARAQAEASQAIGETPRGELAAAMRRRPGALGIADEFFEQIECRHGRLRVDLADQLAHVVEEFEIGREVARRAAQRLHRCVSGADRLIADTSGD